MSGLESNTVSDARTSSQLHMTKLNYCHLQFGLLNNINYLPEENNITCYSNVFLFRPLANDQ